MYLWSGLDCVQVSLCAVSPKPARSRDDNQAVDTYLLVFKLLIISHLQQ